MKRRRAVLFVTAPFLLLFAFAVVAWVRGQPDALELVILKGVPVAHFRPASISNLSETTYYVQADYHIAVKSIERDVTGWHGQAGIFHDTRNWYEPPGPFHFDGRSVSIRRNRIDPRDMMPMGGAADSERWVTVSIKGSRRDPNLLRGFWRSIVGR